jgi:plasmid stabilization system protein ParE
VKLCIARDVPYYVELFLERLIEATDRLQDHPHSGRHVPEADIHDHIRELIV